MISFIFTRFAQKKFLKLDNVLQERIRGKLRLLKQQEQLAGFLKPLTNFYPATHRLRVGAYRIIVQRLSEAEYLVLDIGHRSEIYK